MGLSPNFSNDNNDIERTEIISGVENTIRRSLSDLASIKEKHDCCLDATGVSVIIVTEPIKKAHLELKRRKIKTRCITEITKDNLHYCKEMMEIVDELRHLGGVKGNFGVTEFSYVASAKQKAAEPVPQLILSTVKSFIEQQQYFFDMLWEKAIPALHRIREIEEGIEPEVIETITDPKQIQKIGSSLLKAARKEILMVFPTVNTFHRQEHGGLVQLLLKGHMTYLPDPELSIKIMTPEDDEIKSTVQQLKEKYKQNIDIQFIPQTMDTITSLLVTDKKYSLSVEVKDDSEVLDGELAIGLETYSNSKATVLSYASIFESLWRQSEIYKQLQESLTQLDDTRTRLHDMQQYVDYILKERHRHHF